MRNSQAGTGAECTISLCMAREELPAGKRPTWRPTSKSKVLLGYAIPYAVHWGGTSSISSAVNFLSQLHVNFLCLPLHSMPQGRTYRTSFLWVLQTPDLEVPTNSTLSDDDASCPGVTQKTCNFLIVAPQGADARVDKHQHSMACQVHSDRVYRYSSTRAYLPSLSQPPSYRTKFTTNTGANTDKLGDNQVAQVFHTLLFLRVSNTW